MTSFRFYLPPSRSTAEGQLSNYALTIAGMASPIVDGDGGIGLGVVEDHEQGVFCILDPWSFPMQAGDIVDVYLDANVVWHHEVLAGEENEPLYFFVGKEWFVPGWIERCYYVVHRKDKPNPDDPSVELRLLVKLDRPGGRDKEPHLPGHSELKMVQLPPEVIAQGVDAEWAAKGVPMTIQRYPNIAVRDVIQVRWGSVSLTPLVLTPEQVAGTQPIEVIAEQADILAGGDSRDLPVRYRVHDEVWNNSEDWSISTNVVVDAGAWRLEAPIIDEAVDGIIDLKALNQQDVTVLIHVREEEFEIGDTVTMTWIGTPQVGKPLIHTQAHEITKVPQILPLKIPYAEVRAIAMGSADASHVLTKKNGDPPLSSKRAFASVVGDVYAYPAPVLREVMGEILEPDTPMATVDVSYPGIADGDFIELIWEGTRSNGAPYMHGETHTVSRNDAASKLVTLYVFEEHISILANGRLDLWYRVSNDEAAIYGVSESEHRLIKVQAISPTLPPPIVPEAENDVLDPSKVIDKVTVRVDYSGTVKGDILTYYWTGSNPLGSTSSWVSITTVSAGRPVTFRVGAEFVMGNIGQTVTVRYTLKHATGAYSYSDTLVLLVKTALDLHAPSVKEADGAMLNPVAAKDTLTVVVPVNADLRPDDKVKVTWTGAPGTPAGGSHSSDESLVSDGLEIQIPNSVVAFSMGETVAVSYEVIRGDKERIPSPRFDLTLETFHQDDLLMGKPKILEAANDGDGPDLTLSAIGTDLTCELGTWPLIAVDQDVWLRLKGTKADGTEGYDRDIWAPPPKGPAVNAEWIRDGRYRVAAPYVYLKELKHGSELAMEFKVDFSKSTNEVKSQTFPVRTYVVSTLPGVLGPPQVVQADSDYTVDPSALPGGITVRVQPFDGMLVGYDILMTFEGTANGSATQTKRVLRVEPIDYDITQALLAANSDRTVKVYYQIFDDGKPISAPSLHYPLKVRGLEWNSFAVNGWSPANFQPTTGFDGAFFLRTVRRAIGAVSYSSDRPGLVDVEPATGKVTFTRAWTGSAIITAYDLALRSASYTIKAPARWFLLETLAKRNVAEHYAFVQSNAGKGYRPALIRDWCSGYSYVSTRKNGWFWYEWGILNVYPGWPGAAEQSQTIWLTNDAGRTMRWRDFSHLNHPQHWSQRSTGETQSWTICYRLNT
ncbi:hypothetical protein [Pseudomonas sp. SWRI154]|uniref:hypothetical protein n=1 Tax=Pseudomonas sp. SWRI154 TaxID=2745501 RepID=UPI001645ADA4|nr:hypothetical protein [Pseudomonas sp. SWRI154]MBC3362756.1 hypothetical protein [Pseudomonas sp. SWRI154]